MFWRAHHVPGSGLYNPHKNTRVCIRSPVLQMKLNNVK